MEDPPARGDPESALAAVTAAAAAVGRTATYREPGAELASAGAAPRDRTPGQGKLRSRRRVPAALPGSANNQRLSGPPSGETREGTGWPEP